MHMCIYMYIYIYMFILIFAAAAARPAEATAAASTRRRGPPLMGYLHNIQFIIGSFVYYNYYSFSILS